MFRVPEVAGLNLEPDTRYPDKRFLEFSYDSPGKFRYIILK
jgi:hypothetical protein